MFNSGLDIVYLIFIIVHFSYTPKLKRDLKIFLVKISEKNYYIFYSNYFIQVLKRHVHNALSDISVNQSSVNCSAFHIFPPLTSHHSEAWLANYYCSKLSEIFWRNAYCVSLRRQIAVTFAFILKIQQR